MSDQKPYEQVLRDALENVFVFAARKGFDSGTFAAAFDAGLGPEPRQEHSLTISIRDTPLAVTAHGIPHEWLGTGTSFIDMRFSQRILALLSDLETKARQSGMFF